MCNEQIIVNIFLNLIKINEFDNFKNLTAYEIKTKGFCVQIVSK